MGPKGARLPEGLRFRRSLASRVTLLTTIAVGVSVAAVAIAAYATVRSASMRSLDDSLRDRADLAAEGNLTAAVGASSEADFFSGASGITVILVNARTNWQTAYPRDSEVRAGRPEAQVALRKNTWSARTVIADGERYRLVAVRGGQPGTALALAESMQQTDQLLNRLGITTLIIGLLGIVAAAFAGWGVARNGLRPVRRLTESVEEIARTERLDPIAVEGKDEVARLSVAFNEMLGSLSASRDRQRQLVGDAGHELRTPLTSLRTNIELLAQADGTGRLSDASRRDLMDDVQAQIAEMSTLIGDLVELARDEEAAGSGSVQTVDLRDVADSALRRVRRRAPGVEFDALLYPWMVTGEPTSLERAVTNLLDNAAKWSPPDGTVTVRLSDGVLTVEDQGPGIAEEDLPHVFERFYRSAESRAMPGSGLGLSIVHAVAERHGGTVEATRAPSGGARLTLTLPGSPG